LAAQPPIVRAIRSTESGRRSLLRIAMIAFHVTSLP
jgi:hypothetical protein